MSGEPRYTIRDNMDLHVALGIDPCGWVEIFDRGQQIGSCYMGTHAQNRARAEEIVAILNAHEAAKVPAAEEVACP